LCHAGLDVFEQGAEERGAARVPDKHCRFVENVAREHGRQERRGRLHVEIGVMTKLDCVAARFQPLCKPRVPAVLRVAAGAVEDDRRAFHCPSRSHGPCRDGRHPRVGGHQRPLPSRLSALKTLITAMAAMAFLVNAEPAHPLAVTW
jgi:hypothetical protein